MSGTDGRDLQDLRLFNTADHACGYWPDRQARDLVLDPSDPRLERAFPLALSWGFRRSGNLIYRPHCRECRACVAVRIAVDRFVPNRSQRRCIARNADLHERIVPAQREDAHFGLYRRYLGERHPGGGMSAHDAAEFDRFLIGEWGDTRFLELRAAAGDDGEASLRAVAVTDVAGDALSAVYTFFDPEDAERGLGTYAILRQIAWAKREGFRHLYLGYWIDGHPKMDYKRRFDALERFDGHVWTAMIAASS
jgi:arginyl-tRNA--protein-N-Asp/Glu arginylyltransferase